MKFQAVLLGLFACMLMQAGSKPNQAAQTGQPAPVVQQSLTGCIDEQKGQYVLLDDQMVKITDLQSDGSNQEVFAKYLGRMVQVKGTKSSGQNATFKVASIEQLSGRCGQAK
jgi:hypothetical protein